MAFVSHTYGKRASTLRTICLTYHALSTHTMSKLNISPKPESQAAHTLARPNGRLWMVLSHLHSLIFAASSGLQAISTTLTFCWIILVVFWLSQDRILSVWGTVP